MVSLIAHLLISLAWLVIAVCAIVRTIGFMVFIIEAAKAGFMVFIIEAAKAGYGTTYEKVSEVLTWRLTYTPRIDEEHQAADETTVQR